MARFVTISSGALDAVVGDEGRGVETEVETRGRFRREDIALTAPFNPSASEYPNAHVEGDVNFAKEWAQRAWPREAKKRNERSPRVVPFPGHDANVAEGRSTIGGSMSSSSVATSSPSVVHRDTSSTAEQFLGAVDGPRGGKQEPETGDDTGAATTDHHNDEDEDEDKDYSFTHDILAILSDPDMGWEPVSGKTWGKDAGGRSVAPATTSEVITPRPITPTFGCAKEK